VVVSPGVMHRLPSLWAKPAEFIIDRWLDETLKDEGAKSPFTYMPFLVGPHGCIGRRFALLEASTALAVMLESFSFKPVPDRPVKSTLGHSAPPRTCTLSCLLAKKQASKEGSSVSIFRAGGCSFVF
jgi:cytochrome P450